MWMVAHAADAAAHDDMVGCREHLALLAMAVEKLRWRQLDSCLFDQPSRGASDHDVSREVSSCLIDKPPLQPIDTSYMDGYNFGLSEGHRGSSKQEARGQEAQLPEECRGRRTHLRRRGSLAFLTSQRLPRKGLSSEKWRWMHA